METDTIMPTVTPARSCWRSSLEASRREPVPTGQGTETSRPGGSTRSFMVSGVSCADTALRLARYFGTSERFWMNLQARYDLEVEKDRLGAALDGIRPLDAAS